MESLCPNTGTKYALLDFMQFCEEVRNQVEKRLGEDCEASIRSIMKNNHTEQTSITIRVGQSSVLPTIYLESFYKEYRRGAALTMLVDEVLQIYENNKNPWTEGLDFSYAGIRDKVAFRLVNYGRNEEVLMNMPHIDFDEWAICFECVLTREGGNVGSVKVENRMMREWNVGLDDLIRLAVENTPQLIPPKVDAIENVLAEIMIARLSDDASLSARERKEKIQDILNGMMNREEPGIPMYILSNAMNHCGACTILNIPFMDSIREKFREDFYILPSSIHELILIPASAAPEKEQMLEMVREVNEREVPEEDYLSEGVYNYDSLRKKICAALHLK